MSRFESYATPAPGGAMVAPPIGSDHGDLRLLNIFDGVPTGDLDALIASGGIERRTYDRDQIVADPLAAAAGSAPFFFVMRGQVSVAVFEHNDLIERRSMQERWEAMSPDERESMSALQPPPLARTARKNLAAFLDGDVFNASSLANAHGLPVAFFTLAPTTVCVIQHRALSELAVKFGFFEARIRRAIYAGRERLANLTGVKQELLDFFVRHGISVSGEIIRIRQLDRCIDCKQCEDACEERYGARRLTLGGYQLGMLDFVFTCRTCTDQRCIDPCAYDSIRYDAARGEVVINEATCTGCTLCAQSCPYHAIEMVDVEDPSNPTFRSAFKKRLEKSDALKHGPGAGRVARARRIANKCDHCVNYSDQACVSACPTGALIEIPARDLFRERSELSIEQAKTGYDHDVVAKRRKELLPTEPFTQGLGIKDGGEARIRRGRLAPVILWGVGLAAFFLAMGEIVLRLWWPAKSLQYVLLRQDPDFANLPVQAVIEKISYRSGSELSVWCGLFGTGLMAVAAIYPVFRRVRAFRFFASNTMWFDFHMMAGTVGPMFVLLHAAFKLDSWVSAAFWSMVIVVVSGVVGRYLYTQVPDLLNGRELEELDNARALARIRTHHPVATSAAEREVDANRNRANWIAENAGVWRTLGWVVMEDLRRPGRWLRRKRALSKTGAPKDVRKELARRGGRMLLANRRRVLGSQAHLLLHSWKKIHVPFTVALTVLSAAHIWVSWGRAF